MAGTGDSVRSQHPADLLIRELIATGRRATEEEVAQIKERLATAPFPSAAAHYAKHVMGEAQWALHTSLQDYVGDLRRAIQLPVARLGVYERRGGMIAVVLAPVDRVLPAVRLSEGAHATLAVVYAADRGIVISGYQFSSLEKLALPERVLWL